MRSYLNEEPETVERARAEHEAALYYAEFGILERPEPDGWWGSIEEMDRRHESEFCCE